MKEDVLMTLRPPLGGAESTPADRASRQARRAIYRRLLVPLDGTLLAEHALPFAEALATATGAQVLLIRVDADDQRHASGGPPLGMAEAGAYLELVAGRLRAHGCVVETAARRGDIVDVIVGEAGRRAIDLVIIATHGRGMLGRGAGSSVAEQLLPRLPVPILLVRAWHGEAASQQFGTGARIVVPLDGSPLAEAALPVARAFANALAGDLILVHVARPTPPWVRDDPLVAGGQAIHDYLDRVARELAAEGLSSEVEIYTGDAAREIVAAIHRHEAAVVVIATHGQTGIAQMPIGSVARAVLWDACVPVALIRPVVTLPDSVGYAAERVDHQGP